ncbi:hypothetical protein ILUMI_07223 [Ignelater luminosus]|uniref:Integral membrane protein 2 n=1 Tax=Ignelater luminosus TaxID=2038154 RepID=A0A8K0GEL6_IGNLU|nr:hypothetical protein ILUMI_07223 [Ignelater luminosus]
MTIITKPISEKKSEKLVVPLVDNEQNADLPSKDVESAQSPESVRMVIFPARVRRVSTTTTLFLLVTALLVVGIGIAGGTYLYQQYLRSQLRFKGWCTIPYNEGSRTAMYVSPNIDRNALHDNKDETSIIDESNNEFLQEEFELDLEKESYEKIDVPDFRDGRSGRFIHDFNANMTGIIDVTGRRCFVMPLNRGAVLPPRSLFDLIHKMWEGYYKVNTEVVRETMHVSTPPLTRDELKSVGSYISKECDGLPVYKLEKYVGGVVKRSAEFENEGKFAQFAGTRIVEFDIVNLHDVKAFEQASQAA